MIVSASAAATENPRHRLLLLGWLLDFSRRDLTQVTAAEWSDVRTGLDRLTWKLVGHQAVFPEMWLRQLESKHRKTPQVRTTRSGEWLSESKSTPLPFLRERHDEARFRVRLGSLTRTRIQQLQQQLRGVLDTLRPVDSPPLWIQYPSIPATIQRVHLMNVPGGLGIRRVYGATWRDLRWLAIATLLEEFGEQIGRCRSCSQFFVRIRRQAYCSSRCSQKVRSDKWYAAHRELAQKRRRQSYRRALKRQFPNLTIAGRQGESFET